MINLHNYKPRNEMTVCNYEKETQVGIGVENEIFHKDVDFVATWLRGLDSNQRPSGYEPDELPTALPRVIQNKGMANSSLYYSNVKLYDRF